MRQVNFIVVFVFAFALVWFSLQNTDATTIKIFTGIEIETPLAIALLTAMGIGSGLAWFFTQLFRLQSIVESRQALREIRDKNARIEELEAEMQQYQAEAEADRSIENKFPKLLNSDSKNIAVIEPQNSKADLVLEDQPIETIPESANSDFGDRAEG